MKRESPEPCRKHSIIPRDIYTEFPINDIETNTKMAVNFNVESDLVVPNFPYDCSEAYLEEVLPKFIELLDSNKSIAVACPFLLDFKKASDIEELSFFRMTGEQQQLYKAWRANAIAFPDHDWTKVEEFENAEAREAASAQWEAVKLLYSRKDVAITPEQAKAWVKVNKGEIIKVYGALKVFILAKRAALAGYSSPDIKYVVESLACTKLKKVFVKRHHKKIETGKDNVDLINKVVDGLKQRINQHKARS